MKRLAVLIAVALLYAGAAAGSVRAVEASRFFSVIDDLPLMPGLDEDEAQSVAFDSPQGRIVEAYAEGEVGENDVRRFYGAVLPQLGWRETGPDTFSREREILKVEFPPDRKKGTRLTVHFSLAPVGE